MSNELAVGQSRVGFIVDGDSETPLLAAELSRSDRGIFISIPFELNQMPVSRWFSGRTIRYGDDPDWSKHSYEVPEQLHFVDVDGTVGLVGCRSRGLRSQLGLGVSRGQADVRYAVLGTSNGLDFNSVSGFRSELTGLGSWLSATSIREEREVDAESRLKCITYRLEAGSDIEVDPLQGLRLIASFSADSDRIGHRSLQDRFLIESSTTMPSDWASHIDLHQSVRDLVNVAAWKPLDFVAHHARRGDDPHRALDGTSYGEAWREVVTTAAQASIGGDVVAEPKHIDWLFDFNSVGPEGVRDWLRIRAEKGRAIAPIVNLLFMKHAALETRFAQLGIGLEALGYLIALEQRVPRKQADSMSFAERLKLIFADTKIAPPIDSAAWVTATTDTYNRLFRIEGVVLVRGDRRVLAV
ncbi:MAG: hypothetical protein HQ526_07215 [Actinobacteria bacterium]|nr:hypothetical protein [Actinomycetota bacterium]